MAIPAERFTPAAGAALGLPSGDVIEVERTVSASGTVSLAGQLLTIGSPLAGQRITLRLDGPVAHILSGGILARTIACPSRQRSGPGCARRGLEQRSRHSCPTRSR